MNLSIGSRIKARREQLGITQPELARLIGVTKGAIGNYETDANSPKASMMYRLFDVLKCDANYLFQDETEPLEIDPHAMLEQNLLTLFNKVNGEGQEKIIDYADDLVRSGKYEKKSGKSGVGKEA
jgi:transcriptional regulator with XRE-family HTH domain